MKRRLVNVQKLASVQTYTVKIRNTFLIPEVIRGDIKSKLYPHAVFCYGVLKITFARDPEILLYGNLEIMFPMVSSINEFRAAKTIVEECKKELDAEGLPYNDDVKIGIMIEVPSIAIVIDRIIDEIDFASIGTNDLVQYLCSADRMNEDVQEYYQNFHPSLFLLLSKLVDTFSAAGKCLSICGEMGGDPIAIPLLIGMGIRTLSMNNSSIAKAKQVIRSISAHEVMNLAKEVLEKDVSNLDVENRLNEYCKYLGKVMS